MKAAAGDEAAAARSPRRVALATLVIAAVAFGALCAVVIPRHGPLTIDQRVLDHLVSIRTGWLDTLAKVVTEFGLGLIVYPVLVAAGLCYWLRTRALVPAVAAVAALALGQLVRLGINTAAARPRPPVAVRLVRAAGYAFPSGHTTTATIGYGLTAMILVAVLPRARWAVAAVMALVAIAVGLSRAYLGVHWATDVIGGWLLGVGWLALAVMVSGWTEARIRRPNGPRDYPV